MNSNAVPIGYRDRERRKKRRFSHSTLDRKVNLISFVPFEWVRFYRIDQIYGTSGMVAKKEISYKLSEVIKMNSIRSRRTQIQQNDKIQT
jgi:hypothetical protein